MPERYIDRHRRPGLRPALAGQAGRGLGPVLALQRSIGNRAVTQVLARTPVRTGTVQIAAIGAIKVTGGNLDEWTGKATPDTVDVTSVKGKHSAKLERLSAGGTRTDVKVTIAPGNNAGEELSVGGGTLLEFKGARIENYAVSGGAETWRVADFLSAHRTKITHRVS